jgi:nucleoid-associated protein YgaU
MSYYKKIKGKNYDRDIIEAADRAVTGKGDGRISLADARKILKLVRDGGDYTDIEKRSMQYIRDNYKFTPESDKWFRTEIRKWAASKTPAAKEKAPVKKQAAKPAQKVSKKKVQAPASDKPVVIAADASGHETTQSAVQQHQKGSGFKRYIILALLALVLVLLFVSPCGNSLFNCGDSEDTESQKIEKTVQPAGTGETPAEVPAAEEGIYVVQPQDSLISISERLTGDYKNWEKIYEENKKEIVRPSMIFSGQKLKMPENIKKSE